MRIKLILIIALFCYFCKSQITNPLPYCNSNYISTSIYPELSKVTVYTLTNISVHSPTPGYTYYNNLSPVTLTKLSTYTLQLTFKNVDAETMIKAWIDYNNNSIFETSELIMSVPQGSVGNGFAVVKQNTFSVQGGVFAGLTRMRVSLGWHYANWGSLIFKLDSCHTALAGDGSAGETEDYDVNIINITGVSEINSSSDIKFYPNPVSDVANFELPKTILAEEAEITIYNLTGQKISSYKNLINQNQQIDISKLESGIYFFNITNKNSFSVFYKVVKI